jgi:probable F420-dependent oxidoreductase
MHDPLVTLAAAAAFTSKLTLGTAVSLLAQRDPIITAKEVASIDHISDGRLVLGIGYGWNLEQLRNHGVDPARRKDVLREKVEAMKQLWSEDVASHSGEFVNFTPSWSWPKPVQKPHPPIMVGAGPSLFREIAAWSDGWIGRHQSSLLSKDIPLLRRRVQEAGRDEGEVPIHVIHTEPSAEILDAYQAAGVDGVICFPPPWLDESLGHTKGVLLKLDELVSLRERYSSRATH